MEHDLDSPKGCRPWKAWSPQGRELLGQVRKAAATKLSIYFGGETGTGKDLLAHHVHAWSQRKDAPFIPLNCAALPVGLAESELFGHVKGAYTGAERQRAGALVQAHGGTLFLDEVAELSTEVQVKLLRFLENGEVRPLGSDYLTRVDVRVICATHRPLMELVGQGHFRRDLYFRLASIELKIPPLRERPLDLKNLAEGFAREFDKVLSASAIDRILGYAWPGNVRELRHAVERAAGGSRSSQQELQAEDFEFIGDKQPLSTQSFEECQSFPSLNLRKVERALLVRALKSTRGHRAKAAKVLGVARSTLFEMIKRHELLTANIPNSKSLQAQELREVSP